MWCTPLLPAQVALEVIAFATPPEKLAELRSMFVAMDADRNGTISVDEFKRAMGYSDLAEIHLEVSPSPSTNRRPPPHTHTRPRSRQMHTRPQPRADAPALADQAAQELGWPAPRPASLPNRHPTRSFRKKTNARRNSLPTHAQALFRNIDINESGEIDYTEFLGAGLQARHVTKPSMTAAFAILDRNGDGFITKVRTLYCAVSAGCPLVPLPHAVAAGGSRSALRLYSGHA
jgi:Ca2+-binding EF-hand superfamily protein